MKFRNKKRFNQNKSFDLKSLFKRCFLFSVIFLILSNIISLIISLMLYKLKDNTSFINIGSITSLFLSTLITAFAQSRVNKQYYLLGSIILGGIIFSLVTFIALILNKGNISSNTLLIKSLIPIISVLGGMLGIKNEKKRKKHYR